ncbi:peptidyl-prolyl cis-trans isomerase FKBP5-like isoform X2 [Neoarius graeffei]|uniref:peptidyl-prolyl cis-trans isomerase FKBP5-like isoform X2 n=1 Tax=Neoarius graeffei TaxID=443677 RepID=UPI00298C3272|nr:peptidyl-prolyl cis-trans isomerase FKBP5-like isoform X2 [Neoarius graeffei]
MRGTGDKREILGTRACLEEMAKFEDVCPTAQSFIGLFASQGLDITPNKDRGVCKIVKRHGTESEKPMIGDKVCVRYTGKFLNGKTFDSSLDQKEPFVFNVGKGHVIKAWDIGVHSMQKGEVCILMCKPEYAYGSVGIPPKIPPNSTLLFEVELLSFRGEELTEDGGILRRIKVKGEGYNNPNDGATVHVHLEGRCGGRLFDSRDATFVVGESEDVGVPLGVDRAMEKMQKGECCLLYLKPKYGYGKEGKRELDIGPNAELLYEVTLKDFQLAKQSWEMDLSEKLEQAVLVKQKGTQYFKQPFCMHSVWLNLGEAGSFPQETDDLATAGFMSFMKLFRSFHLDSSSHDEDFLLQLGGAGQYYPAVIHYQRIVTWLEMEYRTRKEQQQAIKALLIMAHLNMALCYLRLQEYSQSVENCNKVVELDSANEKALYRRGEARLLMNEFSLALVDFRQVLQVNPTNRAAHCQIAVCQSKIREHHEHDKKIYANMFQRFAEHDAKNSPHILYCGERGKAPSSSAAMPL